jgi:hypothetical protein
MRPSTRADLLACVRDLDRKWKRSKGLWHISFRVSVCLEVCMYSSIGDFFGSIACVYESIIDLRSTW